MYSTNERWWPWFQLARPLWDPLLAGASNTQYGAWIGFQKSVEGNKFENLCVRRGVFINDGTSSGPSSFVYKESQTPAALVGSPVRHVFKSSERTVDIFSVLKQLRNKLSRHIVRATDARITTANTEQPVLSARVAGKEVSIEPGVTVFAAGAGNQSFMNSFPELAHHQQKVLLGNVLVVEGSRANVPDCNGFFPEFESAFVVSKVEPRNRRCWLFASDQSFETQSVTTWAGKTTSTLRRLMPNIFSIRDQLEWGIYRQPLVRGPDGGIANLEGGKIVHHGRTLAVWPDRLTLAPLLSKNLVTFLADSLPSLEAATSKAPPLPRQSVKPALGAPLWRNTEKQSWNDFAANYGLT